MDEEDDVPSLGRSLEPMQRGGRYMGRPPRMGDWPVPPERYHVPPGFPRSQNVERMPSWPIPLALMEDPLFTRFTFGEHGKHPIGELIGIMAGHPDPRRIPPPDPAHMRGDQLSQEAGLDALLDITLKDREGPSLQGFWNFLLGRGPLDPNARLGEEREKREREAEVQ